jgi:hypothetical protein
MVDGRRVRHGTPALGPAGALVGAVLLLTAARDALAYIDPGTGGMALGSIAPILAALGIVFAATFRYTWRYIRIGLGALCRGWKWSVPLFLAISAGVLYLVLRT